MPILGGGDADVGNRPKEPRDWDEHKVQNSRTANQLKGNVDQRKPPRKIPTPTEEDVGRILNWEYKPPQLRGKRT